MQHFHNETILSSYQTKAAKKRRDYVSKAQNILESYETDRTMEEALDEKKTKALKEDINNFTRVDHKRTIKYFDEAHQYEKTYNEKFDEICKDLFFYTVYESLLVDDEIKSRNFQNIREECNKFFSDCLAKNAISIKENSGFDDIVSTAMGYLKEDLDNETGVDTKNIIKRTVLSEDMLLFYATESIKLKTAECLKNEKKATVIKEQLESEEKYIDPSKSLFRALFESNIQKTIDESKNNNPDIIQDISMVETILDYTILETANTLQLADFRDLKRKIKRI